MEILKRYSISFGIAGLFLYFFTIWVEKKNESKMPHNLSTKKEEIVSLTLVPKRYHEKCVDLRPKNKLQYGFNSDLPLSFNLHYHKDGDIIYVFKEDLLTKLDKIFEPENRAYYCLMWSNSAKESIKFNYHFKILK